MLRQYLFSRRRKFFVSELNISEIPLTNNQTPTQKAHHLLERILRNDPGSCPEWLWSHKKWNVLSGCKEKFNINARKSNLTTDQLSKINRIREFYIRMPNWLGDVVMAIPIILLCELVDLTLSLPGKQEGVFTPFGINELS